MDRRGEFVKECILRSKGELNALVYNETID